jgi:prepilin-type processing-associated H-X9-DG protein
LPAVQSAREAARRMQCVNNLKQLALAGYNYESANQCYPPVGIDYISTTGYYSPTNPGPWGWGHSVFVRMLPFLEQQTVFSAVNFSYPSTEPPNITIAGVGLSTLWCPSDPTASTAFNLATTSASGYTLGYFDLYVLPKGSVWNQYCTSYVINVGPFGAPRNQDFGMACRITGLGALVRRPVTIAAVTDGTSNTLLFSEHTMSILSQSYLQSQLSGAGYPYWNTGDQDQSGFDSQYAPNPQRYIPVNSFWLPELVTSIASSRHPGGVNCAFADGSVKFIKDSINSWPNRSAGSPNGDYGAPSSYFTQSSTGIITMNAGVPIGVWQAISTRSWGEVVSSDQYCLRASSRGGEANTESCGKTEEFGFDCVDPSSPIRVFPVPCVVRESISFTASQRQNLSSAARAIPGSAPDAAAWRSLMQDWSVPGDPRAR